MSAAGTTYTYTPATGSFLFRHVLEPIYRELVEYLPRWLTPNQMTVLGITLTGSASALMLWRFHHGVELSAAELLLVGLLNLVYMVLDNLDGKQARRLKLSSAIGEYLDHGGDCWTSLLSTWCMFRLAGVPQRDFTIPALAAATSLVHLYHIVTGRTTLGGELFSADEGMLTFCIVPVITALVPQTWDVVLLAEGATSLNGEFPVTLTQVFTTVFFLGQAWCASQMLRAIGKAAASGVVCQLLVTSASMVLGRDESVQWVVTVTMLCSFAIHYIIVASCDKSNKASLTPFAAAVLTTLPLAWHALPANRSEVTVAAVVLHFAQMVFNCRHIIRVKALKES